MGGTANAVARFRADPFYGDRVFRGRLLDVGGGPDALPRYRADCPHVTEWTVLDYQRGDLPDVEWIVDDAADLPPGRTFDTIYSSHCLEHVDEPARTVTRWWQALAPGGHLIVIVPSWYTYEREVWPSLRNQEHRSAWVLARYQGDNLPRHVLGLVEMFAACGFAKRHAARGADLGFVGADAELLRLTTLDAGWDPEAFDQTPGGSCESSLEIVIRKRP